VVKKHDFRGIQQKIPLEFDFANNRDMNPLPHGETMEDIAKQFVNKILQKSVFATKNTIFAKIRAGNARTLRKTIFTIFAIFLKFVNPAPMTVEKIVWEL
jgi:hypothetical protein